MSRQKYDVDVLEFAEDDADELGQGTAQTRSGADRRWQTEVRYRARRSHGHAPCNGIHRRGSRQASC